MKLKETKKNVCRQNKNVICKLTPKFKDKEKKTMGTIKLKESTWGTGHKPGAGGSPDGYMVHN